MAERDAYAVSAERERWESIYKGTDAPPASNGPAVDRLAPVEALLSDPYSSVLDLAAGYGELCHRLLRKHPHRHVFALDFSEHAKQASGLSRYVVAPMEQIPFPRKSFDFVTCCQALAYVDDPLVCTLEALRVTKDTGKLIITVGHNEEARNVFNEESLRILLEMTGRVLRLERLGRMILAEVAR